MARTESLVASLIEPVFKSKLSSLIFLFLSKFRSFVCIFFSGDQLGPFISFKTNFSSSLRPSKNFFHPNGRDLGSVK